MPFPPGCCAPQNIGEMGLLVKWYQVLSSGHLNAGVCLSSSSYPFNQMFSQNNMPAVAFHVPRAQYLMCGWQNTNLTPLYTQHHTHLTAFSSLRCAEI